MNEPNSQTIAFRDRVPVPTFENSNSPFKDDHEFTRYHLDVIKRELSGKIDTYIIELVVDKFHGLLENLQDNLSKEEYLKTIFILFSNNSSSGIPIEEFKTNPLTSKEQEILRHLAQGNRNQQIAEELFISPHTVRTHRNNIHRKLKICGTDKNPLALYVRYSNFFNLEGS